jgi:P pilus assembly chaperone PapD
MVRLAATLLGARVALHDKSIRLGAVLALAAAGAAWPLPGLAQQNAPGLLVSPTYVLLDSHTRSQALLLSNRGVAPETYRITIVNRLQRADGQLVDTDKPADGEGFASSIVRYAPREVTLPPNKPQTVRLLLLMPASLPDGEYRSHILFQQVPTEKATEEVTTDVAPGISVTLRAIFGITIPLVVRKGTLTANASLSDLHLVHVTDEQSGLAVHLNRSGTRSLRGDLLAEVDGSLAGQLKNVNVFLSTPYRELTIPLAWKGDLKGHHISVKFAEDESIPGPASATQTLSP